MDIDYINKRLGCIRQNKRRILDREDKKKEVQIGLFSKLQSGIELKTSFLSN